MSIQSLARLVLAGSVCVAGAAVVLAENVQGEIRVAKVALWGDTDDAAHPAAEEAPNRKKVLIEKVEKDGEAAEPTEVARLGVSTEETSEAVSSQLGLAPGAGLLVPYIAPDSPAAKAGLQKNDVLVEFEGQMLVHPVQLRKLVRMHKAGDSVKLEFYRGGRKQTVTAILDKSKVASRRNIQEMMFDEDHPLHLMHSQPTAGKSELDKEQLKIEIRRSLEDARKSVEEALREAGRGQKNTRTLEELARSRVMVDKEATVTVGRSGSSIKTMVKSDESGTYVIVADPKKRLTVHDKRGKLIFDGEIETEQQKEKIPAKIQPKVKSLLEEMNAPKDGHTESEDENGPRPKNSSLLEIEESNRQCEFSTMGGSQSA